MKVEQEPLDTCEVRLTVEVDDEQVNTAKRVAAKRLAQKYRIPGFRKGKAPYDVVVRTLGDPVILEEALDDLGQLVYEAALTEAKLDPYAPGSLIEAKTDPVVFTFNVPLAPEIDLGEFRKVRLAYTEANVAEEALNDTLERMRERQAVLEPVERPAQLGDVVTIDISGYAKPKAETPPAEPAEGQERQANGDPADEFLMDDKAIDVLLDAQLNWPMPGFADKLAGIVADEERHIEMTFPDDYNNDSLRGRQAYFDVQCVGIKSRTLPDWDDELAKSLGDYESLADLREKVRARLLGMAQRSHDEEYSRSVVDIVVAGSTVKFPPILLTREVQEMVEDLDRRLREQRLTIDDYMKINNITPEKLREDLLPAATERLRRSLVLGRVVSEEGIEVNDTDVEAHVDELLAPFGDDTKQLRKALASEASRQSLKYDLLAKRAVARLVAIAKGEVAFPVEGQVVSSQPAEAPPAE